CHNLLFDRDIDLLKLSATAGLPQSLDRRTAIFHGKVGDDDRGTGGRKCPCAGAPYAGAASRDQSDLVPKIEFHIHFNPSFEPSAGACGVVSLRSVRRSPD